MSHQNGSSHTIIDTKAKMQAFIDQHQSIEWLGFDTEFIGERRYFTELCILQVATEHGIFIIDYLTDVSIDFLLEMIESPAILKITHAGENDYRILYKQYNILPKNVVDVQILAAFIGYNYPASFGKIVNGELGLFLNKGFTVTDWKKRPLSPKQLKYAVRDVLYLKELYDSMYAKLVNLGREEWAIDECKILTEEAHYHQHPDRDFIESNLRPNLDDKQELFLLRFLRWRRSEAERLNHSKDMIYPSKNVAMLTRAIGGGRQSLLQNRRIPERFIKKMGDKLMNFKEAPITEEESEILKNKIAKIEVDPRQELLTKILDQMIHLRCMDERMAHETVIPRRVMKKMKQDPNYIAPILETGWRKEFLGEETLDWLKNRGQLNLTFKEGQFKFFRTEMEG